MKKRLLLTILAFSLSLTICPHTVRGQQPAPTPFDPGGLLQTIPRYSGRTVFETQLGWGVLGFGLLAIGLQVAVMLQLKKGWGTQSIRIVGLTLVLTSGLFLIVTGFSQEQIAPMIGLLGTITGFLLGKTSSSKEGD